MVASLIKKFGLCVALGLMLGAAAPVTPTVPAPPTVQPVTPQSFLALAYRDVGDAAPQDGMQQDPTRISLSHLHQEIIWLKDQGYQPVSIEDVIAAHDGKKPLAPKAVLLTFDGGYESFYQYVFPMLKGMHYPAVLSVDDKVMKLTRVQLREIQKSGLIEIASNGHGFYDTVVANPQGDKEPAVVTLPYNSGGHHYAAPQSFDTDLSQNIETSARKIMWADGARPRVIAWPYGVYSQKAIDLAAHHGMKITLTFDDAIANTGDLSVLPRLQVKNDPRIEDFAGQIAAIGKPHPMRAMQVDIDYVYDPDAAQMEQNIDALVSRIHDMGINAVFLQGFADPKGTELTSATYFPNAYLPMRADLFNHVAWLLKTRAGVKIFGWIPVLSFDLGDKVTPVMLWDDKTNKAVLPTAGYHRASPFDPRARKIIGDIFGDMSRYGPLDGVLFHDDALLTDYEDASPPALQAYKKAGLPDTIMAIHADPAAMDKWTAFKTAALIDFTKELTGRVREFRAPVATVRNIFAPLVMNIRSEEWFAQSYQQFLQAYDMTAVEAMPAMENVPDDQTAAWMDTLVQKAASTQPDALQKTLFELQSVDWRKAKAGQDRAISTDVLAGQMRFLTSKGAMNFGYYPDDFQTDTPSASALYKDFSLRP